MKIAIHGLGYVGLTAAVHWARAGWTVYAFDLDHRVIDALRAGTPRASEFLSYLNADVGRLVEEGKILPTHTFGDTLEAAVHSIAIPTEKDGEPWDEGVLALLSRLDRALGALPGADERIVLIESTLTPGTMDRFKLSWSEPSDVLYAVCPRRDWFADTRYSLETLERVVGGLTPAATARAAQLLSNVTKSVIHTTTYREAEFVKAMENAWLHGLVMLPTELAVNRPDIDVAEVVRIASTHWRLPDIFMGAGCGGRCVPLGTKYLLKAAGPGGLFETINTTERHIRVHVAEAIARRVRKIRGARVLVLGVAYRPNFRDSGLSPGLDVARYLRNDFGVEVHVADPMWGRDELRNLTGLDVPEVFPALAYDAVFLATPHAEYLCLPSGASGAWSSVKFVFDAQGAWQQYAGRFAELGIEYARVGGVGWR